MTMRLRRFFGLLLVLLLLFTPLLAQRSWEEVEFEKFREIQAKQRRGETLAEDGVEYPATYRGREIHSFDGLSWMPILEGGSDERFADREMGFELYGFRAYRRGQWKILRLAEPYGTGEWQLYRLNEDPGEVRDLAGKQPDKVAELVKAWERWASEYGVVEPDRPVGYAKAPRPRSH